MEAIQKHSKQKIKDLERPEAIDQESPFKLEELFFSITDHTSNIQFANQVFVRISKYDEQEIIGQLHKIIRHPDMPRSVFHIFWEYLLAGKPVAAYVKNMAKDGSYYWVMALAFPCKGGFLSIRLKPGSDLFDTVKKIYSAVLEHEKSLELQSDKKKAMLAGRKLFLRELKKAGFCDYQEFMWNALQTEMANREEVISARTGHHLNDQCTISDKLFILEDILSDLVLSLGKLKSIHGALLSHSDYILNLARSILLLSMNAQVGSAKLDNEEQSLSVVAQKMAEQSVIGEEKLVGMKESIQGLSELIGTLNFNIVSSKLQVEMTLDFLRELDNKKNHESSSLLSPDETLELLCDAFKPSLKKISTGLGEIPVFMRELLSGVKAIERFLMVLRFIHITGKVEVARMADQNNSFSTTFQDLVTEIKTAEGHLKELSSVITENKGTAQLYASFKEKLINISDSLDKE